MRARMKRRQTVRRILIVVVVVVVIAAFAIGIYYASLPSPRDRYDDVQVPQHELASLKTASQVYIAPSGSDLVSQVRIVNGTSLVAGGRPVVLYVGADYCPYCAIQRWGLILALMRFGDFNSLKYMTSNADGTDYATFTFHLSSYSSNYITFLSYEVTDRDGNTLDTLPQQYTSAFNSVSNQQGYPFIDVGGRYVIPAALLSAGNYVNYPSAIAYLNTMFASANWTQIYTAMGNGSSPLGSVIRDAGNVLTAAICKITNGQPASVCQEPLVSGVVQTLAYSRGGTSGLVLAAPSTSVQSYAVGSVGYDRTLTSRKSILASTRW